MTTLIGHRERLDIVLNCLLAAQVPLEPLTDELADSFPPEILKLKEIICDAFFLADGLLDQYAEQKAKQQADQVKPVLHLIE